MAIKSTSHPEKDKWLRLAVRHLRMAVKLYDKGLADGASFHSYHAFECTASAFLAFKGSPVPPEGKAKTKIKGKWVRHYSSPRGPITEQSTHKAKILIFEDLADKTSTYYSHYMTMSRFSNTLRNATLYYDSITNKMPSEVFSKPDAADLFKDAKLFFELISIELN